VLEHDNIPPLWREVGAAVVSPATGLNRLAFGDRFGGVFRSHDPAVFTRVDLGATVNTHFSSNVNVNTDPIGPPAEQTLKKNEASADLTVGYGLPARKLGTVSVIGPVRMDYEGVISSVREAAFQLSRFVEEVYADDR